MPEPVRVVAAVVVDGGRVLACRRAPHVREAGRWEFPGGKVEPGETPEGALAREIREELGVAIDVGELLDRSTTPVGDRAIDLACYRATLTAARPSASTDHDRLAWLAAGELAALDWAAPDLPAVRRISGGGAVPDRPTAGPSTAARTDR